jgi:hypothetical protein
MKGLGGVLLLAAAVGSASAQAPELRTRAEISNFEETSTYADVARIVAGLTSTADALVHSESFGRTEEGRSLLLLAISDPKVTTPEAARRLTRPIVFVQANIHAGEVEGKEAALMLARRLAFGDLRPLAREFVILIAPDYNADGNEKVELENRAAQYGPVAGVGTRENSRGLDLNRDYMKLDSAEARALVGLIDEWDPHMIVDLHTTNGSYHANHLTYSPILTPSADARLIDFSRDRLLPAVRAAMLERHGWRTFYYGNFVPEGGGAESAHVDPENPGNITWRTFDHRPRFGNNYIGLRNRIAILSEAYSYLDFARRVEVTEDFVEEILRAAVVDANDIMTLTSQADRRLTSSPSRVEIALESEIRALPRNVDVLVGDVRTVPNARSGREMLAMTEMAVPVSMKDYGVFVATRTIPMPEGWIIPSAPQLARAIEKLRLHGIEVREVLDPGEIEVERFTIASYTRAAQPFQGHREAKLTGAYAKADIAVSPGALFVPADQRLARLAFYLIEPESDDGLVTWNVIEDGLEPGRSYPIYRVTGPVRLKFKADAPHGGAGAFERLAWYSGPLREELGTRCAKSDHGVNLIHRPLEGTRLELNTNSKYHPGGAMLACGGLSTVTVPAPIPEITSSTPRWDMLKP